MSAQLAHIAPDEATEPSELRALLLAAAQELDELSRTGDRLHALLARSLASEALSEGAVEDAQLIDFLVQHLETVGLFLRLVADEAPAAPIDYARLRGQLPLADLAGRLGGAAPSAQAPSGDLDLF